jgi:RNA polymerase sigma factor (sigma-70 family)
MAHPAVALFFATSSDDDRESPSQNVPHRRVIDSAPRISTPTAVDDASFRERIRAGDKAVFAELYTLYFEQLSATAYRYVHDPAAAEDAVHDVFLKLWNLRTTLHILTTVRAYFFMAVINRARDVSAQQRRRAETGELGLDSDAVREELRASQVSPLDSVESDEMQQIVRAAIAKLPDRQRLALTLRLTNEMTYDEIAAVLGITKSSVAELIAKAQRHLGDALRPRLG